LLNAFVFRAWKLDDPLLIALDALRELYATGQKTLPPRAPTAFLKPAWRKLIGTGAAADLRAYQVAVMMALRDRLRSGDIWVEGSRAFRAFDDFLLPPGTFAARQRDDWDLPSPAASRRGAPNVSASSTPGSAKSMRSRQPASSPKRSSPQKGFRSARSARMKTTDAKMSRAGSMACCLAYASPSFSPKCMAGQDSPSGSLICAPERRPRTT
jgi:hypothetical protein